MSLSSLLADKNSVLRVFLARELPDVAAVRRSYRERGGGGGEPVLPRPPAGVRPAWGTLGAAIDHRLRLDLADEALTGGAVELGARLMAAPLMERPEPVRRALRGIGVDLLDEIRRLVRDLRPHDRARVGTLAVDDEQRLARVCFLAASAEEVYRSGRLWPGTLLGDAGPGATLESVLAGVPDYAVADLVALAGLAREGLAEVRATCAPADVVVGPTFAGSQAAGGADADWIAGGLLVDVKSTVTPQKLVLTDVYQLAGYLLLDHDDHHRIDRVGWYIARTGRLVTWERDEFLDLLGATRPVDELRRMTVAVLTLGPPEAAQRARVR